MGKELVPPDPARCQAEIREGSFMTLGPRSWSRCTSTPSVIITERKPGPDGRCGSMSLCASCLSNFAATQDVNAITIASIEPAKADE